MKRASHSLSLHLFSLFVLIGLSSCGFGQTHSASAPPASTTTGRGNAPIPTFGTSGVTVTMKENGQRVLLKKGQTLLLALDTILYDQWTITTSTPDILTLLTNATLPPNTQAVYQASNIGQTILKANGDLKCSKANPPCGILPRPFQIQITVSN